MVVRFTDGVGGDTRLDLDVSEESVYVTSDDFSLGVATLQGEPGTEGAAYGYRELTFKVIVRGSNAAAMLLLSRLAVEVQRERNWLMIQFDAAQPPVWWQTYKTTPGALDLTEASRDGAKVAGLWQITVDLTTKAHGWGAEQTFTATVGNNPAAGTNRCRYVLPALLGDSPTPLSVQVTPSVAWQDYRPLMSLIRHDTAAPAATVWQAEAFTVGTDTTITTGDSSFSNNARAVVSFATGTAMASRLTGTAPSNPAAGRYKVLARVARSDTTTTFAVRLLQTYGTGLSIGNGTTARLDRGTSGTSGFATLLDLGDFVFPLGSDGLTADQVGAPAAPVLDLQAQRLSGTGAAWIDYLVAIPIDTVTTSGARTLLSLFRAIPYPAGRAGLWDADLERFRAYDTVGGFPVMAQSAAPEPRGQYLLADPSGANVFHLHHQVDAITGTPASLDNSDSITATAAVVFSYHPRWLNIAVTP